MKIQGYIAGASGAQIGVRGIGSWFWEGSVSHGFNHMAEFLLQKAQREGTLFSELVAPMVPSISSPSPPRHRQRGGREPSLARAPVEGRACSLLSPDSTLWPLGILPAGVRRLSPSPTWKQSAQYGKRIQTVI